MGEAKSIRRAVLAFLAAVVMLPLFAPTSLAQDAPAEPDPPACIAADGAVCGAAPTPTCPDGLVLNPATGGCEQAAPPAPEPPADAPADAPAETPADGAESPEGEGTDADAAADQSQDVDAAAEGEGDAETDGDTEGESDTEGEGDSEADGEDEGDPDADGEGEGADGEQDGDAEEPPPPPPPVQCAADEYRTEANTCRSICPTGFRLEGDGSCSEILDPSHPCVVAGRVPSHITTNAVLSGYAFLTGTSECVTHSEFERRVGNFEAAAGEEKEALDRLNRLTTEVLSLEEQLADLEIRLSAARNLVRDAKANVLEASSELSETRAKLSRVRRQLAAERRLFERQAIEAYMGGGDAEAVTDVVLSMDNANLFRTTIDYAKAVLDDRKLTIARIAKLEADTLTLQDEVEDKVDASRERISVAAEVELTLGDLLQEQRDIIEAHGEKLNESAEQVSSIRERKAEFASELGARDGASKDIEQILIEAQLVTGQVTSFDGEFIPPVNPLDIASFFGPRLHPILGYVRNHDGIDLDGPAGGAIYAAADGTVVVAGTQGGYGTTVVLDHGGGLGTLYAHQSALAVRVGDRVNKGEVIGYIGSTGLSTGPHLHWEVRINGVPVDPMPYLSRLTQ